MGLVPDKILTDSEIEKFVSSANSNADLIVGESKFEIPNPSLPGTGLLIKMYIRQLEGSFATYISPIALFKDIISNANPADLISKLTDAISDVNDFFSCPVQAIIDQTINKKIAEESPFPIKLIFTNCSSSPSGDAAGDNGEALKKLIDQKAIDFLNKTANPGAQPNGYQYNFSFNSSEEDSPSQGEILLDSDSLESVTRIKVLIDEGSPDYSFLSSLKPGDSIRLSYDKLKLPFTVINQKTDGKSYDIEISRSDNSELDNLGGVEMVYPKSKVISGESGSISPEFSLDPSSPNFSPALKGIKRYIVNDPEDGYIIMIPLGIILQGFPLADQLSLKLGNFSDLADENPTRIFINNLESRANIKFNDALIALLSGRFPILDFDKIERDRENPGSEEEEVAKEGIFEIAKLFDLAINDTLLFITIILGYIKLLLLPLKFLFGVLEGFLEKIVSPTKVIQTVIKVVTNPLRFFCELVAEAALNALESYLAPPLQAANITYEEAKETQERGKTLGLKILLSDIVCGGFFSKFENYEPNQNILSSINSSIPINPGSVGQDFSGDNQSDFSSFPYQIGISQNSPERGQMIFLNPPDSKDNVLSINFNDSTGFNSYKNLVSLVPGSVVRIIYEESNYFYRINETLSISDSGEFVSFSISIDRSSIEDSGIQVTDDYLDSIGPIKKSKSISDAISTIESQISDLRAQLSSSDVPIPELSARIADLEKSKNALENESDLASLNINNPDKMYLFLVENYLPVKVVATWEAVKGILGVILGTLITVPDLVPAVFSSIFSGPSDGSQSSETEPSVALSAKITGDFIAKVAESSPDPGMLKLLNSFDSDVSGSLTEDEPRSTIRKVFSNFLYSQDPEERIESALLSMEEGANEAGFDLSINGDPVDFNNFVKRIKIQMAVYESLKNQKLSYSDSQKRSRKKKLDDEIDEYEEKKKSTLEDLGRLTEKLDVYSKSIEKIEDSLVSVINAMDNSSTFFEFVFPYISNFVKNLIVSATSKIGSVLLSKANRFLTISSNLVSRTSSLYTDAVNGTKTPNIIYDEFFSLSSDLQRIARETEIEVDERKSDLSKSKTKLDSQAQGASDIAAGFINQAKNKIQSKIDDLVNAVENSADYALSGIYDKIESLKNDVQSNKKSLSSYQSRLDYLYKVKSLEIDSKTRLWKNKNDKYNYFEDAPLLMTSRLVYDNDSFVNTPLIELYLDNQMDYIGDNINTQEGVKLEEFRALILDQIRYSSDIIKNIGK